jgi:hypothetical protein
MSPLGLVSSLALVLSSAAGVAHAQTDGSALSPPAPVAGSVPAALVDRPVVLPNGMLEIRQVGLDINLSKDNAGKPIRLTIPNVSFGIADNLEVGIFSGDLSPAFAPFGALSGFCLSSSENCGDHRFDSIAVEAIYRFMAGPTQLAAHGVLNFTQISDPMFSHLAAGVLGKYTSGKFAVAFDPSIHFGLSHRDMGNKEFLSIPVSLQFQFAPNLAGFVNTGLFGPFDGFGDSYSIPVGLGALFNVNPMVDLGGAFTFENLLGKNNSADYRALFLFANIRPIAI